MARKKKQTEPQPEVKKSMVHKLKISNKNPGQLSTGANTMIELDGKQLRGVIDVIVHVGAANITRVTFQMLADIEIDQDLAQVFTILKPKDDKISQATISKLETTK